LITSTHQALTIFDLFHKGWKQVQRLFEHHRRSPTTERCDSQRIDGVVEAIVEGTDIRIRGVINYKKQLQESALNLLEHIEDLVDSIPAPTLVDNRSLIYDPLARILFPDEQTIKRILIYNRDIKTFLAKVENTTTHEFFALLLLHHKEKTILGSKTHGQILMRDVRQITFSFYGHRLVAPSPNEELVRTEMLVILFECVLRYLKTRQIEARKRLLTRNNHYLLNHPEENINNPEVYLRILIQQLSSPQRLVKLEQNMVRMSRTGIKLPLDSPEPSYLFKLHELQVGDDESSLINIIRCPKDLLSEWSTTRVSGF
jgi:hypothetical protein